ncbi:MAG TPA: non-heme iron oxygenase ferredoxin subunit [Gammaproteobacteria bacterium]|nr:non-heme iron oxygenase ferredoxin subunit [Gammaproteobacteria bacterium]
MASWHDVTAADDIEPGGFALLETDELTAAVFNVDGTLYAIEDVCTHDGAELAGGPVVGDQVVCPRHGARFCLRTGAALCPPAYEPVGR